MTDPFRPFDVVRIARIHKFDRRGNLGECIPKVGDIATVIDVYASPATGYEMECCDSNGKTLWLYSFADDEVDLEFHGRLPEK